MKSYILITIFFSLSLGIQGDQCTPNPCQNNATCKNKLLDFECICEKGFTGTLCEVKNPFYHCNPNLCQNNATCVSTITEFTCECSDQFYGKFCENRNSGSDCRSNGCFDNGVCEPNGNGFRCTCKPEFYGTFCQNKRSPCAPSPCFNYGFCSVVSDHKYKCHCPYNYYGSRCEEYDYFRNRRIFLFISFITFLICIFALISWISRTKLRKRRKNERQQRINTIFGQNFEMRNPDLDPPEKQPYNFNADSSRRSENHLQFRNKMKIKIKLFNSTNAFHIDNFTFGYQEQNAREYKCDDTTRNAGARTVYQEQLRLDSINQRNRVENSQNGGEY
ncbi:Neurogenic locus Notch [Brachionus plicatilis]|uniref:Neurogenic locus Notch n=1 Tax=Brachionus plicatilis TaxID=10195 RepID=A0A3M7QVJ7_BRAPC|nr:Neurogenic locus Notch [Brachionus plicatilis]